MSVALRSLAPLTGIPLRVSADFVCHESGVSQLVVSGSVDVTALPFVRLPGRRQATLESVAIVIEEGGELAATLPTDRTAMDLSDADYERVAQEGIAYQRALPLKPGRYQVRFAARDDATGLLGSAWQWVEIPELVPERLTLSSLFLLKDGASPGALAPVAADGGLVLRNAQAHRHYRRGESLYAQLYAYNPKRDSAGEADVVSQAEILRQGAVLGTAAPEEMEQAEPGETPVPHTSRIKLNRFEPGDYELRVTVTDRVASAIATRRVGFTID
jgi:hypothetical protein